jgi:anti-sigma regulatory factor (Ser/Thr protein kinase)
MEIVSTIAHIAMPVSDHSQVGEVRRAAKVLADQLQFSQDQAGKLAIIVTEAATNLVAHAKQGEFLLCPYLRADGQHHIDVVTIDRGPGISDLTRSMDDGFSTAGTPGNGLGAIRRLSNRFEMYSQVGSGTVLLASVAADSPHRTSPPPKLAAGFICIPIKGEQVSGDTVALRTCDCGGTFMVADGLGHGISANEASIEAGKIFAEERDSSPTSMLTAMNQGLRATRGAAVAIASIDCKEGTIKYSGVGNVAGAIFQGDTSRSLVSHNGIVGHQSPRVQEFTYQWPKDGLLVMNSDGLVTNWRLNQYPGLMKKDPVVIAAVLYRDFSRGRDDVAILVVKEAPDA